MRISSRLPRRSALLFWCLFCSAQLLGLSPSAAADKVAPPAAAAQPASSQPADQSAQDALLARINEYWSYKIAGNLEKAYAYEDPDSLAGTSISDYVKAVGGAVKWLEAKVQSATIAGDKAKVLVNIRYYWTFSKGEGAEDGVTSQAAEFWRLHDGVWYHRFVDPRRIRGAAAAGSEQPQPQAPAASPEGDKKP